MSKKHIETPRKSARLVERTYIDEVHVPSFNILTQTPPPKIAEIPATSGASQLKDKKEKKIEAKKRATSANQKGKKRKGKIVETPFESDSDFHKFRNIVFTDEEINDMDQINLHQSSSHHETKDQAKSERHDVDFDEKYVELKKEIAEDDARQHVEESEKALMDQPSVSMRKYVHTSNTDANWLLTLIYGQTYGSWSDLRTVGLSVSRDLANFLSWFGEGCSGEPRTTSTGRGLTYGPWMKAKYSPIPLSYSTVDCWFMTWVDNIEKQCRESNYDMRSISPDHDVGQCIRGFKLLANIPWDSVDDVIIPVNISEKFHWFLVVFRIKLRCLHVYDSMKGGYVHTKKVNETVGKLATMIPLFLTSTRFYGKRLDLYANKLLKYVHKSQSDPLDIKNMMHAPQ
uniref:Ulp1 protease family, C-terminal catalytic domain containing protein n=1 Tax=Solanum tuberosum TaxID=4113 RepID=M1DL96_SOLTU